MLLLRIALSMLCCCMTIHAVDELVSVTCGSETIEVFLSREVEHLYTDDINSYVIGPGCKLEEYNSTYYYAEIALFGCNNEYRRFEDNITITNVLQPLIVTERERVLRVRVTCYYSTNLHVDLENFSSSPSSAVSLATKNGDIVFAALDAFKDESFTSVYQGEVPALSLDETYFVGVYLNEEVQSYNVSLLTCWFDTNQTPLSSDKDNTYSDVIITDSCPKSEVASWVKVNERKADEAVKLSLQVLDVKTLRPRDTFVYFHCQVELCYDSCPSKCVDERVSRKRRSSETSSLSSVETFDETSERNILTLKLQLPPDEEKSLVSTSTINYVFYGLLGLLALSCAIIIFVTYRWWKIKRQLQVQQKRQNPYLYKT